VRTPVTVGIVLEEGADPGLFRAMDQFPKASVAWLCDHRVRRDDPWYSLFAGRTGRVDDVLEDDEVDAVVILAPDPFVRGEHVSRALEADKHVLVGGTIAGTTSHAEQLVAEAHRRQRRLSAVHRPLFNAATLALRDVVAEGRLGELYYLRGVRHGEGASTTNLWSIGADEVARVLHVLADEPVEVTARGDSYAGPDLDVVSCLLRFATGITAQLEISGLDPRPMCRLALVGSRATAVLDEFAPRPLTLYTARGRRGGGEAFSPNVDPQDADLEACELFVSAIRSPGAAAPARESVVLVAVLEALRQSLGSAGAASQPAPDTQPELRVIGSELA
jgi:predicted dehydrogenase